MDKNVVYDHQSQSDVTTISPGVLLTIAQLTTLHAEGVSHMSPIVGGVNRLIKRNDPEGVRIELRDDIVSVDLFVVLKKDTNIREVSRQIQCDVARAISEMVGMQVGRVNVHVEDIDYSAEDEA